MEKTKYQEKTRVGVDIDGHDEFRYLIVRTEKGGVRDLVRYSMLANVGSGALFLMISEDETVGRVAEDDKWVIVVSIIVGFFCLLIALLRGKNGKVVVPQRGTETFISTTGHLDERIDLNRGI